MRLFSKKQRDKSVQAHNEILSEKDFYQLLEGERARAERYQHSFSLIVFKQAHSTNGNDALGSFAAKLARRRRKSDIVGWIATDRIGIILPLTSPVRARLAAERLFGMTSPHPKELAYDIMAYPPIDTHPMDKTDDFARGSQSAHAGTTQLKYESQNTSDDANKDSRSDHEEKSQPNNMTSVSDVNTSTEKQNVSHDGNDIDELLAPRFPFWKRALDIAIASTGLVLLSPLFLIVALLIKTTSPGPIFFKQERIGRLGKKFTCWKFRTMKQNTDVKIHKQHLTHLISSGVPMTKLDIKQDPRLIPCAKFLRAMGIDELPQLFNVLRGEMSFIGPRPCIHYEYVQFKPWQKRRFDERPGLTGLWQVSGKNMTTFDDMMRLDITYGRGKSFWSDLNIIIKTFPALVKEVERVRSRRKKSI